MISTINSSAYYFQDPKTQSIPCWTEEDIERIYLARGSRGGFFAEQEYYNNDIHKYYTLYIYGTTNERFAYVSESYGLLPSEGYFFEGKWYYKFVFNNPISHSDFEKRGIILSEIYQCSYSFYRPHDTSDYVQYNQPLNLFGILDSVRDALNDRHSQAIRDPKNNKYIVQANEVDPQKVVEQIALDGIYDKALDIILGYGSPFTYVQSVQRSMNSAFRFFKENFNIDFVTEEESTDTFMRQGVMPASVLYQHNNHLGYTKSDKFVAVCDFIIYVHYRLIRKEEVTYMVSIVGKYGSKHHIEWHNFTSDQQLSGYVQGLGAFHILDGKSNYKLIHEYISTAVVPEINVINKFGLNEYKGRKLIVYADAIVDIETKKIYDRFDDSNVFFLDSLGGVRVETPQGVLLLDEMGEKTPYLGDTIDPKPYKAFHKIMKSMFIDNSSNVLMLTLCTWMGNIMYNDVINPPLFFVTGASGSGKTTYGKILSTVFGIEKPLSLEGTTAFPLRMGLTYIDGLPFFMSEFRTRMGGIYEKTQIIKALFDGTPFERGKKDLSIDRSVFSAGGFIEGEELPESGATRTRLVIHTLTAKGQKPGVIPEQIIHDSESILKKFQYSYIMKSSREEYTKAMNESHAIFIKRDGGSSRIIKNLQIMYASTMAFAPDRQEEIIEALKEIQKANEEDYSRNNTGMEVIKIAGRYLQSKWAKFHIDGYHLVLPWQELAEYVQRSRVMTELSFDSYRPNLEGMGFQFGFFEVRTMDEFNPTGDLIKIDGIKIYAKDIPEEFKCNKHIYQLSLNYEKNKHTSAVG